MIDNPNILSHVSIGVSDLEKALCFYDNVLATIGAKRIAEQADAIAYGRFSPEFWIQKPVNGKAASVSNDVHFSFFAHSKDEVDSFFKMALSSGGNDQGGPGPRPDYGAAYYGCCVTDLDGHRIEATYIQIDD